MLLLTSVSDLVTVITASAGSIRVHADWVDNNAGAITPGRTNTPNITTATTTTVVAAPASSVQRNVKNLTIHNEHATISNAVAVQHTDGTNAHDQVMVTLLPRETLIFDETGKWTHYDGDAVPKISSANLTVRALDADQSNSTTTPTAVSGLTLPAAAGVYRFHYGIRYQAAAATTGVKFDVNFTGTVTSFVWQQRWVDVSATAATAVPDQDSVLATGAVVGAFASRAKGTAGRGVTLSVDTAAADMLMIIEGLMVVTVAGDLVLYHGSEVAAQSTVMAGSIVELVRAS